MSAWSRRFCIWCLLLVLPLQGLAASCLLPCAGSHAPTVQAVAAAGTFAAAHPCHAAADALTDGVTAVDDGSTADADHRCSACAACCAAAAALPASAPVLGQTDAVRESGTAAAVQRPGVVAAGLERPPRAAGR